MLSSLSLFFFRISLFPLYSLCCPLSPIPCFIVYYLPLCSPLFLLSDVFFFSSWLKFPFNMVHSCLQFWAIRMEHIMQAGGHWLSWIKACMHTVCSWLCGCTVDLMGMVVDEKCQIRSICAYQSCSRNLIRPPGPSMKPMSILTCLPISLWEMVLGVAVPLWEHLKCCGHTLSHWHQQ